MKAIVFGGTGFIGSHVAEQLALAGHTVTVAVRKTSDREFINSLDINISSVDFSDVSTIKKAIDGHEVVYNCTAAATTGIESILEAEVEINLTKKLIEQAALSSASRFIQLSTVMVYDLQSNNPMDESYISNIEYPIQRVEIEREKIVEEFGRRYDIETFILRPASTIGARDRASFFSNFFSAHTSDNYIIVGDGENKVSFVDTRDIGRAMVWLGTYHKKEQDNGVFLVKGFDTTWNELKKQIDEITGRVAKTTFLPKEHALTVLSPFEVENLIINRIWNDNKIRSCGFYPKYSLENAVENAIKDLEKVQATI